MQNITGKEKKLIKSRLFFIIFFFFSWFTVIIVRQLDLQVSQRSFLLGKKFEQQKGVIKLIPRRGDIFDRNGRILAMSLDVDSIYAVPDRIVDPVSTARLLSNRMGMGYRTVLQKLNSGRSFVWIKRKIEPAIARSILSASLPGIYSYKESKRYYPHSDLAANVIGFAGIDNDGLAGIEYQYDHILKGKPGAILTIKDARRNSISTGQLIKNYPTRGKDIHLTLDSTIQFYLEDEIIKEAQRRNVRQAFGIIIEPHTGEILAMASYPGFDLNKYYKFSASMQKNRAIQVAYEPGSTFKIVAAAIALEAGQVKYNDKFYCEMGGIKVADHYFKDHKPFGVLNFREIIANSSNVGIIKIGLKIGPKVFASRVRGYGFGSRTGVDLPGENAGIARPYKEWSPISAGSISIGQEISVNALQLILFFAEIANGGYQIKPRILKSVSEDETYEKTAFEKKAILNSRVVKELKTMMEKVVIEGTGKQAAVSGYRIAGKTGTAQKASSESGTYIDGKYVSSFVGFAPVDNPQFAMIIVLDEPDGVYYGGDVAAPVFSRVAKKVLRYLKVNPQGPQPYYYEMPKINDRDGMNFLLASFKQGKKINLETARIGDKDFIMPKLIGRSYREVFDITRNMGLKVRLIGSGKAVKQYPEAGVLIRSGSYCAVNFSLREDM